MDGHYLGKHAELLIWSYRRLTGKDLPETVSSKVAHSNFQPIFKEWPKIENFCVKLSSFPITR